MKRSACAQVSAQRGVTLGSLGDHRMWSRSCASGGGATPLVSTSTRGHWPTAAASNRSTPGCASGSPPVTTSSGASPRARSAANASATVRSLPPAASQLYLVSHQWQPTSQPWSLRKCAGMPADGPSPWSERKTSATRSVAGSVPTSGAVLSTGTPAASVPAASTERELFLTVEALPGIGVLALGPRHPVVPAAAGAGDVLSRGRFGGRGFGRGHGDPPVARGGGV